MKSISLNKDLGIEKNIYKSSNEQLMYNDETYDNNLLNYDNEHFLKNIEPRQNEGKEYNHNIANTNEEKKENIVSFNNSNIVSQNKENPIQGVIGNTLESNAINRKNFGSNLQLEKIAPLSYQHPHQEIDNIIHPKMYIFSPEMVDFDLISRFTGKKNYILPICDKNEYPSVKQNDNYRDTNGRSHFIETKKELDSCNLIHNLKTNPNIENLRNIRSQWKIKSHSDCFNTNDHHDYNKSPLDFLHLNKISDMNHENERSKFTHLQMNNIGKEDSYALHSKMNTMLTEEKEQKENISNNTKADKSNDKVVDYKIEETAQINTNITGEPLHIANSVSGAQMFTNNSELDKLHKAADDNLLISNNKNNLISSVEEKHTPHYTQNVNTIATDLYKEPKRKPKISTGVPSPTSLDGAMKPNESYIYFQQPVPNSAFLQKAGVSEPVSLPNISSGHIVSDTIIKNENTNNDLITISIDPKTLQNKILHAEFLKNSDLKKNPDTLSIELEPNKKISQVNASQQKTVSAVKPIQISASKKNNSIIITGGHVVDTEQNQGVRSADLSESQQTNKKNQQDLLDKRFEKQEKDKPLISRMVNDRQKKSISISSMDINDEYTTISTKIKRDTEKMNVSKLISMLKPVFVLSKNEDETGDTAGLIDPVNPEGSEVNFEKGNKKIENKILEGFINSIIANYSKDEAKQINRETTEKNEEEAGALFKLLENNLPKGIDTEEHEDNKSGIWNLTPILVPESSISKFEDNSEYDKLGPFDENLIKSFLEKDSIPYLQEKL